MVRIFSLTGIILIFLTSWLYLSQNKSKTHNLLKIYGYSNFINSWGPGPKLAEAYERQCDCTVELFDMGDSALVLEKLKHGQIQADLIVGLDQLQLLKAKDIEWLPLIKKSKSDFFDFDHPYLLAISWAPFSFIYRRSDFSSPPTSLHDLTSPQFKKSIALLDPRTSSAGLQFLAGIFLNMSEQEAEKFLMDLKPNIHSISPSWSTAYGLFKNKEAKLVFSYATSAIYHWVEENNEDYQAINLNIKHPIQIELVGIPKTCQNCNEALKFSQFLIGDTAQKIIMNRNYMMPIKAQTLRDTAFEKIRHLDPISLADYSHFDVEFYLQKWKNIFSR